MQSEGVGHQSFTAAGVVPTSALTGPKNSSGRVGRADKGKVVLVESEEEDEEEDSDSDESMEDDSDEDSNGPNFATSVVP